MRTVTLSFVLSLFSLSFSSCLFMGPSVKGNGQVTEQVRSVKEFKRVKVTSGMNVYLIQGNEYKVVVVADENLQEMIEARVEDGTLEIKALASVWKAKEKKVIVTAPGLEEINGTAGSNIYADSLFKIGNIKVKASAGSNVHLNIEGQSTEMSASSGANIFIRGGSQEVISKVSTGANIKAGDLLIQNCDASASSGGNIWLNVKDKLKAHASSGGNIFYSGTPAETNVTSSSGGNIIKK
jgi:hypothetical protein